LVASPDVQYDRTAEDRLVPTGVADRDLPHRLEVLAALRAHERWHNESLAQQSGRRSQPHVGAT
jgi:hypothetical protein